MKIGFFLPIFLFVAVAFVDITGAVMMMRDVQPTGVYGSVRNGSGYGLRIV